MKRKTYIGDLSELSSCIKIKGTEVGLIKVVKKLTKNKIPFTVDNDFNILIKFEDYLKSNASSIQYKGITVCEHIEPLGIDIKLSHWSYSYDDVYFSVSLLYGDGSSTTCWYDEKGDLNWYFGVAGTMNTSNYREILKDFYNRYTSIYYREHQTKISAVLYRRGLISKELYKRIMTSLKYTPTKLQYYEV